MLLFWQHDIYLKVIYIYLCGRVRQNLQKKESPNIQLIETNKENTIITERNCVDLVLKGSSPFSYPIIFSKCFLRLACLVVADRINSLLRLSYVRCTCKLPRGYNKAFKHLNEKNVFWLVMAAEIITFIYSLTINTCSYSLSLPVTYSKAKQSPWYQVLQSEFQWLNLSDILQHRWWMVQIDVLICQCAWFHRCAEAARLQILHWDLSNCKCLIFSCCLIIALKTLWHKGVIDLGYITLLTLGIFFFF